MDKFLCNGKYTADCPPWLIDKVRRIAGGMVDDSSVTAVLKIIKEEFDPRVHMITTTNDFTASRFVSVRHILEKRQYSCGSLASVVAAVLRHCGLPTKLIDGKFIKKNPDMRHAWNEVYINRRWVAFDIMQKDFQLTKHHIKKGEYVDWEELEH